MSAENEKAAAEEKEAVEEKEDKKEKGNKKDKIQSELEETRQAVDEAKDKYLRLFAEFENFRKRSSKERLELISTATEDLMISLIPVLDDFERGMKQIEEAKDLKSVKEGVELIHHKLKSTLEHKGLKQIDTVNEDFNSEIHEAITEIPAQSDEQKGKIIDEVEKGYYLHDKIIRFPKVVVGK